MIRVALDIHTVGQRATGNETYIKGLLGAYTKNPPADIDFTYYHSSTLKNKKWPGRYKQLFPQTSSLRIPFSTPLALLRDKIDVSHFQYFLPPVSPCPSVLTIHDLSFKHHPEFFSPSLGKALRYLIPFMANRAAHIITVSKATKMDLIESYGLPSDKISVIYNSTSSLFNNNFDRQLLRMKISRFKLERPFIISVGNLGPRKNQQRLVKCFTKLAENKDIDFDLVLVGQLIYKSSEVINEIRKSKVKERIHVTGFVTQDELIALYSFAKFSVYPSLFEGFGLPILESMACGTPVITSNCSCMPEIALNAALLVNPESEHELSAAILKLASDTALNSKLSLAGLKRKSEFTWDIAGQKTISAYRKVAS